jgi:hypothetical protein
MHNVEIWTWVSLRVLAKITEDGRNEKRICRSFGSKRICGSFGSVVFRPR